MAKQLIMVVHGVGIRAAGESSDLVAGALDQGPGGWRRRASDDFRIFERLEEGKRLHSHYPARLSRFRSYSGQFPGPDAPERVIADFYWGDVGGFGSSAPQALIGLARVMLGLVHVLRENARTVYPGPGAGHAVMRKLARGAGLAIHGPVFAANVALFLGLVGVVLFGTTTMGATLFAGVLSLGLAFWMQARCRAFLFRHFAAYLGLFGLLLVLFWATPWGLPDSWHWGWLDRLATSGVCSWMDEDHLKLCLQTYATGPFLHGVRLQAVMVALWTFVSLVSLVLGGNWLVRALRGQDLANRDLLMPTLGLMSLLWFLLLGLGWGAVALVYAQIGSGWVPYLLGEVPPQTRSVTLAMAADTSLIFTTSLRGFWAAVGTLALVGVVALGVLVGRRVRIGAMRTETYLAHAEANAARARLIVPDALKAALALMPVLILILIAASAALPAGMCLQHEPDGAFFCWLQTRTEGAVALTVSLFVAVLPFLLPKLALGLYVAGDVIIYLNDFEWRRTLDGPPARTFAEAVPFFLRMRPTELPPETSHVFRKRIHRRMEQLMDDLILSERPDRIDVLSHSQGTVIAIDVLQRRGADWGAGPALTLITMGSPRRHLYRTYFPHTFPALRDRLPGVDHWTNIFRIDDFIGTHVGLPGEPGAPDAEHPVDPGGHTNYWTDFEVRELLEDRLVFPSGQSPAVAPSPLS